MESNITLDHRIIYSIIEHDSRVLDLGCGAGELLYPLVRDKRVRAQGIELNDKAIQACVKKGLSVFHDDIESSLREFPDRSFDYVILNQSMQEVKKVDCVIREALRIGNKVIVGFPNFAYIQSRLMMFFRGRAPITGSLPYLWYDTPNVRFLSITDFKNFCKGKNIRIVASYYMGEKEMVRFWPNLFALNAVFVLTNQSGDNI
ncbi:MAG TPA: methionine biosynthesis protein MetW [Syntrophaceae bacterium]|jgi:methionine biosynthesis protein MetW|nr:methionine biosynthesis protein MetW [Smithellaceae bacterium]HBL53213.1 methionine biosynthesis protein MetW [Syntrophaceae bacterium]